MLLQFVPFFPGPSSYKMDEECPIFKEYLTYQNAIQATAFMKKIK